MRLCRSHGERSLSPDHKSSQRLRTAEGGRHGRSMARTPCRRRAGPPRRSRRVLPEEPSPRPTVTWSSWCTSLGVVMDQLAVCVVGLLHHLLATIGLDRVLKDLLPMVTRSASRNQQLSGGVKNHSKVFLGGGSPDCSM